MVGIKISVQLGLRGLDLIEIAEIRAVRTEEGERGKWGNDRYLCMCHQKITKIKSALYT